MVNSVRPLQLDSSISIATAAYGNAATTRLCLQALRASASGDFELLLIDDCSPDDGATAALFAAVREYHANTRIFRFTENLEYSGSVNAILSHATGHWVLFVSNDIFITPAYLRALLEAAVANPRAGILRGSSNFVDNGLVSHNIPPPQPVENYPGLLACSEQVARQLGHTSGPDPFLVGDAFLVRRAVLERIGTFDPLFFGYFADQDYGVRVRRAGFDMLFVPGAYAWHQQDSNFAYLPELQRSEKLSRRWQRIYENWARFKLKYGLPVSLAFTSTLDVPWNTLASASYNAANDFCAPGDYSRYLTVQGQRAQAGTAKDSGAAPARWRSYIVR